MLKIKSLSINNRRRAAHTITIVLPRPDQRKLIALYEACATPPQFEFQMPSGHTGFFKIETLKAHGRLYATRDGYIEFTGAILVNPKEQK
jgi:hypothetical protein